MWPDEITPFYVYLIQIGETEKEAHKLYDELKAKGLSVLWDDRDERPGAKFADADLLGIPHRVVISPKLLEENKWEYKKRLGAESEILTHSQLLAKLHRLR